MSKDKLTNKRASWAIAGLGGKVGELKSQQAMTRELLRLTLKSIATTMPWGNARIDFSGLFLMGMSFEGLDLRGVNFRRCDLSHANFRGCNLHRAKLRDTILTGANFAGANLTNARFEGALCDFSCDLTGATFANEKKEKFIRDILTKK